jgi:predicted thioesterase
MKTEPQVGAGTSAKIHIDEGRTIDFLGEELRVYATPSFIADIELTCLEFLQTFCEDSESSVGIAVNIAHTGATPLGMDVEIKVTVSEVDGRRVMFDIAASDGIDDIGTGSHGRFVVDVEKLKQRVAAKVAKANA